MHIHILGICGKFMSGLALIAHQKGYKVTGSDQNLLPSISEPLKKLGIELTQGYEVECLPKEADCVVIGNALSRGRPIIEHILNENIPYYSGPEWLKNFVLKDRWVLAVSGTHGKTTTTSMLAWILEVAGLSPGFLIGGQPLNFEVSARYMESSFFVVEADEYDTAFFDKRSKFMHYQPRTLIINNLEFDHADIFDNLEDIKKQFHHMIKIIPSHGLIVSPYHDENVDSLFEKGSWTRTETFGNQTSSNWSVRKLEADGSEFDVFHEQQAVGTVKWNLLGEHNMLNAMAAIAAARHVGVSVSIATQALSQFQGVKRRLELRGQVNKISVYDDFAHHPTAISTTLAGLRQRVGTDRIIAVLEFGSNTMRGSVHQNSMASSFQDADRVVFLNPIDSKWDMDKLLAEIKQPVNLLNTVEDIVQLLASECRSGDHIVCMSNLVFDDIHQKLLARLGKQ